MGGIIEAKKENKQYLRDKIVFEAER